MQNLNKWLIITHKKIEAQKTTLECIRTLSEHPNIRYISFQFIHSKPSRYPFPFVRTTYPAEWVNFYLQNNYVNDDPVVRHANQSDHPFFWSEVKPTQSEQLMVISSLKYGLSPNGYSIPTYDLGPFKGLFSLNINTNVPIDWEAEINKTQTLWKCIALKIHQMARNEIDPHAEFIHSLSKRELECLRLIADGKTHSEIAVILNISEHTTRGYLRSLRLKLSAATLAQAVANAKDIKLL